MENEEEFGFVEPTREHFKMISDFLNGKIEMGFYDGGCVLVESKWPEEKLDSDTLKKPEKK